MANETHIGRRSSIGLAIETTKGTAVTPADFWLPKESGKLIPDITKAEDMSAYGVIDPLIELSTVKNKSILSASGILTDDWIGYLLYLLFGSYSKVVCATISGISGGTPARGDAVGDGATWTGVIKKIINKNATDFYFIEILTGTEADGTITDGVWTGTADFSTYATVKGHFFQRLNTNEHPTATIYDDSPVGQKQATYGMISEFSINTEVENFIKTEFSMEAKKLAPAGTPQVVAFTNANKFRASDGKVYFADNESLLNGASPSCLQSVNWSLPKNLLDYQCIGDDDVNSFYNQQFGNITGDFTAKFDSETLRDYVINSTEKSMRIFLERDDLAPLYTTGDLFPSIIIDMGKVAFESWDVNDDNDVIIIQTVGYRSLYDISTLMQTEVLLLNNVSANYNGV